MDPKKLEKIGLNRNEAEVYVNLLQLGQTTAGELIKRTGFHRNIIYDNLEKLIDKGLVSFILEGKRKIFQAAPAYMLTEMLEEKQRELDAKKKTANKIKEQIIKEFGKTQAKQEATIYRGIKGLKFVLKDTLEKGKEYYVFGAPKISLNMLGSAYWKNYNIKRKKKKQTVKMIFNDDLRNWSKQIKDKFTQIRFLPKQFDSLTETIIYENNVAIIVWTETPIVTLIRDKEVAKGYKQHFDILWKASKR
jgi:sugar-specific transcriptional regulator TrmB